MKVVVPMNITAGTMSKWGKKEKDTPIANASMLVAIARGIIAEGEKEASMSSSSWPSASYNIFAPIKDKSKNAIQWSIDSTTP